MVDTKLIRALLHDMANKLMTAAGTVSLMRLEKISIDSDQLEHVETSLDALGDILTQTRELVKQEEDAAGVTVSQCIICTIPETLSDQLLARINEMRKQVQCHGFILFDHVHMFIWVNGHTSAIGHCYAELANLLVNTPLTVVDISGSAPDSPFETLQLLDPDSGENRSFFQEFFEMQRAPSSEQKELLCGQCIALINALQ